MADRHLEMFDADGGPAFPVKFEFPDSNGSTVETYRGMTLRDYFAGQALAGICGDSIPGSHHRPSETAKAAYEYADMMLREREKRGA